MAGVTEVNRPPSISTSTSSRTAPSTHARSRRYDAAVAHDVSLASVSASASTPARQSAISACSAGEWDTPVGLRTKSIALRDPACMARIAGVVTGLRRDHRPVAGLVVAGDRAAQGRVEADGAGDRLGGHLSDVPSRPARSAACRSIVATSVGQRLRRLAPRVEPGGHPRGHGVGAVGRGLDPAERRPLAGQPGLLVGRQRGHRVGQHRVAAVLHPRRAGVVGLPGEVESVAPVRPDPARHPDRRVPVDEVAALLDVQLDEAADRSRPARAGRCSGSRPAAAIASTQPHAVPVPQLAGPRTGRAGRQPRAEAGQPEAGALLLDEHRHPDRPRRPEAALPQQVDRRQRRDHAERPVVRPAVEHRVEVRPGQDPRSPARRSHQRDDGLPKPSTARARSPRAAACSTNHARSSRSALAKGCRK